MVSGYPIITMGTGKVDNAYIVCCICNMLDVQESNPVRRKDKKQEV